MPTLHDTPIPYLHLGLAFFSVLLVFVKSLQLIYAKYKSNRIQEVDHVLPEVDETEITAPSNDLAPSNIEIEEDLIADIIDGGQSLLFLNPKSQRDNNFGDVREEDNAYDVIKFDLSNEHAYVEKFAEDTIEEIEIDHEEKVCDNVNIEIVEEVYGDNGVEHKEEDEGEGGKKDDVSAMVQLSNESASKSSWEWRSSTNYRDSEMDELYSSSSFSSTDSLFIKKYDEEMMFFDRMCAQKLQETESFRLTNPLPKSIPMRVVKTMNGEMRQRERSKNNPYHELEAAYVAQICLTWEALTWNYNNLKRLKTSKGDDDSCYGRKFAQQLQEFNVLLQRYIETEPYEYGRRPEIYARTRIHGPKLLKVPEFREENEDEEQEEDVKISATELLLMIEESIRMFMIFLKTDRKSICAALSSVCEMLSNSPQTSRIRGLKHASVKKKKELKLLKRGSQCFTTKLIRKPNVEEFEILLSLIDLKLSSRVLRMSELNEERLHWCNEKISKVRIWKGKVERDTCPIFYPTR